MFSIIPELERRYSKFPDQLLENIESQFFNFVKATSCYYKEEQDEAIKSV